MKIMVNGTETELQAERLDTALIELGYADLAVATAHNERFVAAPERAEVKLHTGDRLEIVAPRQGG